MRSDESPYTLMDVAEVDTDGDVKESLPEPREESEEDDLVTIDSPDSLATLPRPFLPLGEAMEDRLELEGEGDRLIVTRLEGECVGLEGPFTISSTLFASGVLVDRGLSEVRGFSLEGLLHPHEEDKTEESTAPDEALARRLSGIIAMLAGMGLGGIGEGSCQR